MNAKSSGGSIEEALELLRSNNVFVHRLAEENLLRELKYQRTFGDAISASSDAIIIADLDANIIYVNPAWEKNNGYTLEEVRGKNPRIVQSGKTPKAVYEKMWNALISGQPFITDEIVNKRKDGSEYREELTVSPVLRDGKPAFYFGITRDITKQKEIDKAKSEFVSLTAHQLRSPLTLISWNIDGLLQAKEIAKLTESQKKSLKEIMWAAHGTMELIEAFLNLAKIESGNFAVSPRKINVFELANMTSREHLYQMENKNISFSKNYAPGAEFAVVDPVVLRVTLQNFLSNAAKYTQAGGKIDLFIAPEADKLVLKVSDTGPGILPEERDKIFTKFFRSKYIKGVFPEGNGIGLYLVKMMADRAGGKVWFTSPGESGLGTTFYAEFPLV